MESEELSSVPAARREVERRAAAAATPEVGSAILAAKEWRSAEAAPGSVPLAGRGWPAAEAAALRKVPRRKGWTAALRKVPRREGWTAAETPGKAGAATARTTACGIRTTANVRTPAATVAASASKTPAREAATASAEVPAVRRDPDRPGASWASPSSFATRPRPRQPPPPNPRSSCVCRTGSAKRGDGQDRRPRDGGPAEPPLRASARPMAPRLPPAPAFPARAWSRRRPSPLSGRPDSRTSGDEPSSRLPAVRETYGRAGAAVKRRGLDDSAPWLRARPRSRNAPTARALRGG